MTQKRTVFDIIRQSILLKQPLDLLLNAFYCPFVYSSPEASLPDMMEGWCNAVGPNEVVDVETLLVTYYLLAGNFLLDKKHLCE
jgi:hypothetical protein